MKQLILQKKINLQTILSSGKMKITEEKFNKLKQMDRIEYRQKEDRINEKFDNILIPGFINFSLYLIGFILLLSFASYNISKELFVSIFSIIYPVSKILFIFGLIVLFIDIISVFAKKKKVNELNEEYFSVEVKK
ncbi:hypothetical protein LCGC14_1454470 [marine sediment metagenome]|uniref:Uncharacterized protein n=1 Tax=marine sediment metagenome TaxID=412755 RepID=A0A0F9K348_9ZZZZ